MALFLPEGANQKRDDACWPEPITEVGNFFLVRNNIMAENRKVLLMYLLFQLSGDIIYSIFSGLSNSADATFALKLESRRTCQLRQRI